MSNSIPERSQRRGTDRRQQREGWEVLTGSKKCLRSEFVVSSCPSRIKLSHFVICFGFHPSQTNQQMQCVYRCFLDKLRSRHRRLEDCSISQIVRHDTPIKHELKETCLFVQFNRGANSLSESTCSNNENRKSKIRLLLLILSSCLFNVILR